MLRPADMPMMPICTAFNPDGRITMRNMPYPDGLVAEHVWCGTCTHAGEVPLGRITCHHGQPTQRQRAPRPAVLRQHC